MREAILHIPKGTYAHPVGRDRLQVLLRLSLRDECSCYVYYDDRYKNCFPLQVLPMEKIGEDDLFSYYRAILELSTKRFGYCFCLRSEHETLWYSEEGLSEKRPEKKMQGLFQYPYLHWDEEEGVPAWAKEGVIYQIFPDRFFPGEEKDFPNQRPWGSLPRRDSFYGGDLKGIMDKLSYLEELGINVLYLTPIFNSPSNHRYDTINYYQIHPLLGTEETFRELISKAYDRGIGIIMDGVFNHTSHLFPPFLHLKEYGSSSKYSDWFHVHQYPITLKPKANYETFGQNIPSMPRLNTYHEEVQEYLLQVGKYWTKRGISGWRFDVANEVNPQFWQRFRQEMKEINPEIFLTGEIWHHAEPWLKGDMFDSVMNYPFRELILDYLAYKRKGDHLLKSLFALQMLYKHEVNLVLWNILGTHDTPRLKKVFHQRREAQKLALLLQFTYPGIPHIYYGDEVGLMGGDDPDCRRTMIWEEEKQDQDLLKYYQTLIKLRKEHDVLKEGTFRSLNLESVIGYSRIRGDKEVLILLNQREEEVTLHLQRKGLYRDLLAGGRCSLNRPLKMKGETGLLLKEILRSDTNT